MRQLTIEWDGYEGRPETVRALIRSVETGAPVQVTVAGEAFEGTVKEVRVDDFVETDYGMDIVPKHRPNGGRMVLVFR